LRRAALAAAAALALLPAGCGGDDKQKASTAGGGQKTTARSDTGPSRDANTNTQTATDRTSTTESSGGGNKGKPGPEDQQGGAGDEEPAHSQVLLTGRNGRISPKVIRVAPFISVRVELRSGDGRQYSLRIAGKNLRAGGGLSSASTTLDGLRFRGSYNGRGGDGSRIRIEANAEPGP
jgi:hypothetical protein